MKILFCIYTSKKEKYVAARARLEADPWFIDLRRNPDVTIIDILADETVSSPVFQDSVLRLPMPDDYLLLAKKTFGMIKYLTENVQFDYLIKIDDTTVDMPLMNLIRCVPLKKLCFSDYAGVRSLISTLHHGRWQQEKGIHMKKLIPKGIPYFAGKFYVCSHRACAAITVHGQEICDRYVRDHAGVEDVFVAVTLYRHFFPKWKIPYLFLKYYFLFYTFEKRRNLYFMMYRKSCPYFVKKSSS